MKFHAGLRLPLAYDMKMLQMAREQDLRPASLLSDAGRTIQKVGFSPEDWIGRRCAVSLSIFDTGGPAFNKEHPMPYCWHRGRTRQQG
jgi:hypothetical protein